MPCFLPIYDCINDFSLLCSCLSEVDTSGFDTFMPHKVSQERNVIASLQKAFGKPVTKGVRIHYCCIDAVLCRQLFQLTRDATGGNTLSIFVQKK